MSRCKETNPWNDIINSNLQSVPQFIKCFLCQKWRITWVSTSNILTWTEPTYWTCKENPPPNNHCQYPQSPPNEAQYSPLQLQAIMLQRRRLNNNNNNNNQIQQPSSRPRSGEINVPLYLDLLTSYGYIYSFNNDHIKYLLNQKFIWLNNKHQYVRQKKNISIQQLKKCDDVIWTPHVNSKIYLKFNNHKTYNIQEIVIHDIKWPEYITQILNNLPLECLKNSLTKVKCQIDWTSSISLKSLSYNFLSNLHKCSKLKSLNLSNNLRHHFDSNGKQFDSFFSTLKIQNYPQLQRLTMSLALIKYTKWCKAILMHSQKSLKKLHFVQAFDAYPPSITDIKYIFKDLSFNNLQSFGYFHDYCSNATHEANGYLSSLMTNVLKSTQLCDNNNDRHHFRKNLSMEFFCDEDEGCLSQHLYERICPLLPQFKIKKFYYRNWIQSCDTLQSNGKSFIKLLEHYDDDQFIWNEFKYELFMAFPWEMIDEIEDNNFQQNQQDMTLINSFLEKCIQMITPHLIYNILPIVLLYITPNNNKFVLMHHMEKYQFEIKYSLDSIQNILVYKYCIIELHIKIQNIIDSFLFNNNKEMKQIDYDLSTNKASEHNLIQWTFRLYKGKQCIICNRFPYQIKKNRKCKCRKYWYCSKKHQKIHWKKYNHRIHCTKSKRKKKASLTLISS